MSEDRPHLLIVDDDDRLRALLSRYLSEQGFLITAAADAAQARKSLSLFIFDAIILDVMMPGESGIEFLSSYPAESRPPVLMLSAMGETEDRIRGLETGADDYLTKPFEPKELVLRIRSILRRHATLQAQRVRFGDYHFDLETGQLQHAGQAVYLTTSESAMLRLLAEQAGKPVAREALAKLMPAGGNERSVDVQITRLRKKIEASEKKPQYLQTVRGAGYVLYANEAGAP